MNEIIKRPPDLDFVNVQIRWPSGLRQNYNLPLWTLFTSFIMAATGKLCINIIRRFILFCVMTDSSKFFT